MNELSTRYNPRDCEDKWYKFWEEKGYFHAQDALDRKPFSIVIPPPNVTGILHMGHALNNTIQDILIRYHRMSGRETLWMPGIDHAGIATQNVVEKSIAKEGLRRQDLGREKFVEKVWDWKERHGSTIIRQLKRLGASCDWQRLRFTMDAEYSASVLEVFVDLYQKGLIYRGTYIINWCPRCQTALADEEAPHQELEGSLYYLKYPLKDDPADFLTVATTRPETMLGDTAVAVNPKDKRYKKLMGRALALPLLNKEIKVIADSSVDMAFGTGAVKVTPAHDPADYALGKKHKLDFINVMQPDGRMNEHAGRYQGMERFQARQAILDDLKAAGLVEKVEPHIISAGHCYRCHTIIEPFLSRQWFVKMKPLAGPAIEAVKKGKVKFYPERWKKVYLNWMENIQDWCISRQIWWGHRLPVYYCADCQKAGADKGVIVSIEKPQKCPACSSTQIRQDEDVLDTWFSSWLWPFATFYWPFKFSADSAVDARKAREELKYFYPTSTLVTAPEIIFFWVARMIMAGFEFMHQQPFKEVYIHGTVRDVEGRKMSKSLGNIIDPLDIIGEYGSDALRFSLISLTSHGQDVFLSKERFEQGRNFANKIWNASRFIVMNLDTSRIKVDLCQFFGKGDLDLADRWILSRFYSVLRQFNKAMGDYRLNEAVNAVYGFFWHEFCDWYLEIIKPEINKERHQVVMYKVLEKTLRILHPYMPFITEEVWQLLPHQGDSIMIAPWPHLQENMIDARIESEMEMLFGIIKAVRNLRAELEIDTQLLLGVFVYPHNNALREAIGQNKNWIMNLGRLGDIGMLGVADRPAGTVSDATADADIYLRLGDAIDACRERAKITDKIEKLSVSVSSKEARLKNPEFTGKAPREIVEKERAGLEESRRLMERLERMSNELH
ncbi:MAG: valine--tRNA ligase [Candidatus Omnitrophota bacterium]